MLILAFITTSGSNTMPHFLGTMGINSFEYVTKKLCILFHSFKVKDILVM